MVNKKYSANISPTVFAIFLIVEWAYTLLMRMVLKQTSFELEFIAFSLSSIGLSLVATIDTDNYEDGNFEGMSYCFKQLLFIF